MGSRLEKNSKAVLKRIEDHAFSDETGEEYESSAFGGFTDYFRRKKIKLQNLDSEIRAASSADKPQIFKGVVAHVTGYTQPPLHILHRDLVQHGAGFLQYLDSKTMATHIIASSLPPKKMVDFNKYRIVKPAWVTDSIQAGKLLPWSDYRVIEETPRQKTLKFDNGKMSTLSHSQSSPLAGYREQTENSFYTSQLKSFAETIDGKHVGDGSPNPTPSLQLGEDASASPSSEDQNVGQESGSVARAATSAMTSEEHNALLLQDPRMRKSSTANPDFIQQYYSESRLHHLSTWKAELKSKMQKLAADKGLGTKPPKRKPGSRRYVMHVDFDSFFCAVSLKSAPEFLDKPAVVAHGTGTGSEIASCNYPARNFGVKNGMWMKRAKELCPELKVLPYDFPAYEDASRLFYESILEVGGTVQSVSIDEALIDVTSVVFTAVGSTGEGVDEGSIWREQEKVDELALRLRDKVQARTGCAVSVGMGGNILLAKVALRKAKPAGQYQLKPEEVQDFLGGLKVDDLPGVAYSITGKLEEIGVKYVNDVRQVSKERLVGALGPKTGEKLWEFARGIDRAEVGDQPIRKSVSAEVNWGIRFINQEEAEEFVYNLCKELERRLLNEQVKGKQLTMKIMRRSLDAPLDPPKHLGHGKCDTFNKSTLFGVATHDAQRIGREAVSILRSYKFSPGDLRGLGVQLTKLEPIKTSTSGLESSQKKLNFGTFQAHGPAKKPVQDLIQEIKSPDRPALAQGIRNETKDPIVDGPLTPRKPKSGLHPAFTIAKASERDAKAKTPLNIGGTQFVLPANPDPAVFAELPPDIQSRLLAQSDPSTGTRGLSPSVRSRTQSPALGDDIPSDIDPDVFNALPEEMKAEILATYKPRTAQSRRPQSPRKDRFIQAGKKTTPTKRRVPGIFAKARERHADAQNKVVQTSFLAPKQSENAGTGGFEDIDPDFLAELPEEMRKEVLADHRRRKAQRSGLDLKLNHKRRREDDTEATSSGQTKLLFTPKPAKVAFTNAGLTGLAEIRAMLKVWHRETQSDGPHRRDVDMFGHYLSRVVLEERDMDKATKLVQWLEYLVDEDESATLDKASWQAAVAIIKVEVQKAVHQRGLGSSTV
ncbi:impB/mucB/samB family protein [Xylariales sp. PMI_506]|nr:impB/mucB/samB family protein [Xylariales sp. PMI_506]